MPFLQHIPQHVLEAEGNLSEPCHSTELALLCTGTPAPAGKDWDNWRISVYWNGAAEFYSGKVCEPDGETADLAQLKVEYDDGKPLSFCASLLLMFLLLSTWQFEI